jgi:hypothetical protein
VEESEPNVDVDEVVGLTGVVGCFGLMPRRLSDRCLANGQKIAAANHYSVVVVVEILKNVK